MNTNFTDEFEKNGFLCLKDILPPDFCNAILTQIESRLAMLVRTHQVSNGKYFSVVNRWPVDSLLDIKIKKRLIELLQPIVCNLLGCSVKPYEMDVIYKSLIANQATPCHQDIAYAWKRPYQISTWIPLTDMTSSFDSGLQFLPGSHKAPIEPGINFWIPNFCDEFRKSSAWIEKAVTPPITRGSSLLFSSKIWHASLPHFAPTKRIAFVVRWGSKHNIPETIPKPLPVEFGIWNCGDYTKKLLIEGLKFIKNQYAENFEMLISQWQIMIQQQEVPFEHNAGNCLLALEDLSILHNAYNQYKGGDNQGVVYPRLWLCLLQHLKAYLIKKN